MYKRRKTFSILQDELSGEERLFSTTEVRKNDPDEIYGVYGGPRELKSSDQIAIDKIRRNTDAYHRDDFIRAYEQGDTDNLAGRKSDKVGAGVGVVAGLLAPKSYYKKKNVSPKHSLVTAVGTGLAAGIAAKKISKGIIKDNIEEEVALSKKKGKLSRKRSRELDRMKYADNRMSRDEFIEKYGTDDDYNNYNY